MKQIDKELEELNLLLIKMCDIVIKNITLSIEDLSSHNDTREVNDDLVDQYEKLIEEHCIDIVISHQPVAKDLRLITGILKVITDLERIGDHAQDILDYTKLINGDKIDIGDNIKKMSDIVTDMVLNSIQSFIKRDIKEANRVIKLDDKVDELFLETRELLIECAQKNPKKVRNVLFVSQISKYLERIGDHAVNISEWVVYVIEGFHKEG